MNIKYVRHKKCGFLFSGKTDKHKFFAVMTPTLDRLKQLLKKEFPGKEIELSTD